MSSLGFTSKEQRNLGLLVHLMTTNPKILYSPIGSQVDKVIQKASTQLCLWSRSMSRVVHIILTDKARSLCSMLKNSKTLVNLVCAWQEV